MRWHETTGERLPHVEPPPKAGEVELQIVRTVPEKIYEATPRGEFGVLESYVRAFRAAERFIYLENQFLWSPEIASILAEKIASPPTPNFRLVILLPAKPYSGGDDTRGVLGELLEADDGNGHVFASTIYARSGARADPIYVHAKVGIVDDEWLTLGSANLNEHSLFNDTEVNLVTHDPSLAREIRLRLWSEHLELPIEELQGDPIELIDSVWKTISKDQLERRKAGLPLTHRLLCLPHVSKRSGRLLGPTTGLIVDG
jgi:phosphatidylserine/phosphatidylglycerophosphate/cardiolipin synthase-like enzyme